MLDSGESHVLVDVRQPVELEICQLPNALSKHISKYFLEHAASILFICMCLFTCFSDIPINRISNSELFNNLKSRLASETQDKCPGNNIIS